MLAWQVWNQAKGLGVRPSELYDIQWPLARFFFDRGIFQWGTFVEGKLNEVEATARRQLQNARGSDAFATSARLATFNKLMGLSVASAYRDPVPKARSKAEEARKRDTSMFRGEG